MIARLPVRERVDVDSVGEHLGPAGEGGSRQRVTEAQRPAEQDVEPLEPPAPHPLPRHAVDPSDQERQFSLTGRIELGRGIRSAHDDVGVGRHPGVTGADEHDVGADLGEGEGEPDELEGPPVVERAVLHDDRDPERSVREQVGPRAEHRLVARRRVGIRCDIDLQGRRPGQRPP